MRLAGGFDIATAGLILGGAVLVAASLVAAVVLLTPPQPAQPVAPPAPSPTALIAGHTSAALPPDRVATVLTLDASAGAAGVARTGDHVDVFGFFAHQSTGSDALTRVLLSDVPVLNVDRAGPNVSLTLAVPQESALLLQEAQALGAKPFIAVRPLNAVENLPASVSDSDLATRLSSGGH